MVSHSNLSYIYFFFHWLYSPLWPWPLLCSFMIILQTVRLLGRVISSSQGLYLNIGQHKHRINTYAHQTSMPCVGFESTIPASERAKKVHALDRSATVTGLAHILTDIFAIIISTLVKRGKYVYQSGASLNDTLQKRCVFQLVLQPCRLDVISDSCVAMFCCFRCSRNCPSLSPTVPPPFHWRPVA
jgi:hypothetical protein